MFYFCLVLQEVNPHVIITSAKQEHCMTRFLQQLGKLHKEGKKHLGKHRRGFFGQWLCHKNGMRLVLSQSLSALIRRRVVICTSFVGHCFTKTLWKSYFATSVSFPGSNPDYKPEIVTYPYVDFGKQTHWQYLAYYYILRIGFCNCLFYFSTLEMWRSVSRGYFLHICLSFLAPSLRGRKWPTSPPVSPLTQCWWWASSLNIFRSTSPVHM